MLLEIGIHLQLGVVIVYGVFLQQIVHKFQYNILYLTHQVYMNWIVQILMGHMVTHLIHGIPIALTAIAIAAAPTAIVAAAAVEAQNLPILKLLRLEVERIVSNQITPMMTMADMMLDLNGQKKTVAIAMEIQNLLTRVARNIISS